MITVSNNIKNAYNQYTTQRKSYIQIGNNQYFIQNMDLYADAYDDGNIVGNAIAKTLKFDIDTQYVSGLDEFTLYDGIWTGEEYEYINLGTFKLFEEKGTDDFFSSITAYDKLVLFKLQSICKIPPKSLSAILPQGPVKDPALLLTGMIL